jgi:hypothetical protein
MGDSTKWILWAARPYTHPSAASTRSGALSSCKYCSLVPPAAWSWKLGKCHKNVRNHMGNPCNRLKCHETSSGLATHSPHKLVIGKIRVKWCYMCFKIWWRVVSLLFHQFIVDFKHPCSPCTLWGIHLPDIVLPWQKSSFQNRPFIHKLHFLQGKASLYSRKSIPTKYKAVL